MTELVTSGSVGGMASNGCLYPEIEDSLDQPHGFRFAGFVYDGVGRPRTGCLFLPLSVSQHKFSHI